MANRGRMQSTAHNNKRSRRRGVGEEMKYDQQEAARQRERLHRLEMINYTVKVPAAKGAGSAVVEINELAMRMKEIYDQTQELVSKTVEMLTYIGITIQMTDEHIASFYSVNGTCFKPK